MSVRGDGVQGNAEDARGRRALLDEMTREAEEMGLYDDPTTRAADAGVGQTTSWRARTRPGSGCWGAGTAQAHPDRQHVAPVVRCLRTKDTIGEKVMALEAEKAALLANVMDRDGLERVVLSAAAIRWLLE